MLPFSQIKTLDALLAEATNYAEFCMRGSGRMTPALFLIGADGPLIFVPTKLDDGAAKYDFANTARLVCLAHGATACVLALEVWAKFATPGEKLDETEPPSESFDRREFVTLMGEDRAGQKQLFLPIIRSGNGKFFGFGESEVPNLEKMEGRFAQILPPNVATAEHRALAKVMLKVKGVNLDKPGMMVRVSPSRRNNTSS